MMSYDFGEDYVYPIMTKSGKKYWVSVNVPSSPYIWVVTKCIGTQSGSIGGRE